MGIQQLALERGVCLALYLHDRLGQYSKCPNVVSLTPKTSNTADSFPNVLILNLFLCLLGCYVTFN